jgi:hypothetical protein
LGSEKHKEGDEVTPNVPPGGVAMTCLRTENLSASLLKKVSPFFHEILQNSAPRIHSLYLVGSVLTEDYLEKISDINSIIVLQEIDFAFLDTLAPLGKKYRRTGLAIPLIMDPVYIQRSVIVFPIEFLSFKLVHHTLYGEDLLAGPEINRQELKSQCDRELKGRLVWLQKHYVSSLGDKKTLAAYIISHMGGYLPIFRGILHLLGQEPPPGLERVLDLLSQSTGTDTRVFAETYAIKKNLAQPSQEEISRLFAEFYQATQRLVEVVDDIQV